MSDNKELQNVVDYNTRLLEDYERLKTQLKICEEHAGTMARDFDASLAVVQTALAAEQLRTRELSEQFASLTKERDTAIQLGRAWEKESYIAKQLLRESEASCAAMREALAECKRLEGELKIARNGSFAPRDGKWIDSWGACKVCDGEIPHGHRDCCDIYKLEHSLLNSEASCAAMRAVLEKVSAYTAPVGNQGGSVVHDLAQKALSTTAGAPMLARIAELERVAELSRADAEYSQAISDLCAKIKSQAARLAEMEADRARLLGALEKIKTMVGDSKSVFSDAIRLTYEAALSTTAGSTPTP